MRALVLLLGLAGCDRVFGLGDPYEDAPAGTHDGAGDGAITPIDGNGSGSGSGGTATEIAHFRFDGTLLDEVSRTLATCLRTSGTCSYGLSRTGIGAAAQFDGQQCLVFSLPAMPTFLTVALWVNPSDTSTRTLLDRPASSGASWLVQEDVDSLAFFSNPNGSTMAANAAGGPAPGSWHSIVITVSPEQTKFYRDGVDEGTGGAIALRYTASTLYIGCTAQATSTDNYSGLYDDLVIFDGIASGSQLTALF